MSNKWKLKGFTILELLVVVAIVAILAVISIPNFIGRIDEAKASQELAEIDAVGKAIATYYADKGVYPTLQGKDGTLLQAQPLEGAPHNIDFSSLVPDYLASLPHFSYWWVDAQGKVYHTQETIGSITGNVFTPTAGYSYTLYKTNGTTQAVTAAYTLLAGEYIIGADESGTVLPKINSSFKNAKVHPESGEVVVPVVTFTTATFTNAGATGVNGPTQGQLDAAYTSTSLAGKVTSSNGIQLWTVPATGTYRIITYGASGGIITSNNSYYPGYGTVMQGEFSLSAGTGLKILVGQKGDSGVNSGGGGGGTYVTKSDNSPLIISGGGGGAKSGANLALSNASLVQSGKSSDSIMGDSRAAGGGGGLTGSGASGYGIGGKAFTAGGAGGAGYGNGGNTHYSGSGGFGGGGGGEWYQFGSSGGGGGYSGGNSGANGGGGGTGYYSSGGGGSYNVGLNQLNAQSSSYGDGKVIITYVGP